MDEFAAIRQRAHSLTYPDSQPRDAASLILVDRSAGEPKVLLGKRHGDHAFMPGHFVFPGGRIEESDRNVPAAAELHPAVATRLTKEVPKVDDQTARAFALAAIRETFEETGIVIGRKHNGAMPAAPDQWRSFFATGFLPDLSGLRLMARALAPPRTKRRFDARFLAVDASAIAAQSEGVVHSNAELVEIVWVRLDEAMRLPLPDITEIVLADISASISAGFPQDAPAPFYQMRDGKYVRDLM
jgi:8-oxo-dGTP pyrophosphatase MutT (NUDIX family)